MSVQQLTFWTFDEHEQNEALGSAMARVLCAPPRAHATVIVCYVSDYLQWRQLHLRTGVVVGRRGRFFGQIRDHASWHVRGIAA
jgi:hypothetical protein